MSTTRKNQPVTPPPLHPATPSRLPRRFYRPLAELLEDRIVLSTVTWDGGGDYDWNNALNWSGDALAGAADDVVIDYGANEFTVVHGGGNTAIRSLTTAATLAVTGGSLDLAADSVFYQNLTLDAKLLSTGELTVLGLFTWSGGTLTGGGSLSTARSPGVEP